MVRDSLSTGNIGLVVHGSIDAFACIHDRYSGATERRLKCCLSMYHTDVSDS